MCKYCVYSDVIEQCLPAAARDEVMAAPHAQNCSVSCTICSTGTANACRHNSPRHADKCCMLAAGAESDPTSACLQAQQTCWKNAAASDITNITMASCRTECSAGTASRRAMLMCSRFRSCCVYVDCVVCGWCSKPATCTVGDSCFLTLLAHNI
jgi:hypothetical protein